MLLSNTQSFSPMTCVGFEDALPPLPIVSPLRRRFWAGRVSSLTPSEPALVWIQDTTWIVQKAAVLLPKSILLKERICLLLLLICNLQSLLCNKNRNIIVCTNRVPKLFRQVLRATVFLGGFFFHQVLLPSHWHRNLGTSYTLCGKASLRILGKKCTTKGNL